MNQLTNTVDPQYLLVEEIIVIDFFEDAYQSQVIFTTELDMSMLVKYLYE